MNSPQEKRHKGSDFRPSTHLVMTTWQHFLAFGFGSGLSPKGPGTAGTLAAVPLWLLLSGLPAPAYMILLVVLFAFGCWVCGLSARMLGVHDYGGIVFDEIVGFLATCIPLLPALNGPASPQWAWILAAFLLFRLFDIWKPWPIRVFDRRIGGGFGIMVDDLIAALYAAVLLEVALYWINR